MRPSLPEEVARPRLADAHLTKVAVVGAGSIGLRHAAVLSGFPDAAVCVVPARSSRLQDLRVQGYTALPHLADAVQWGASLVIIATETGRHLQDTTLAMGLGLDALVEKPLATNGAEAQQEVEQAVQAGRAIYVGCVLRFSESLTTFRELLPAVGRLHAVRIECRSYLPAWRPARPYRDSYSARATEGGVLRDLIHEIDYAGWLFGWPMAVQARLANLGRLGIEAEEIAELLWETRDGCTVSVGLDYLTTPSRRRMQVHGERGTITWDGLAETVTVHEQGAPSRVVASAQTRDEMFAAQAQAFLAMSRGRVASRLATGEDGVKALAVCDAARRSASTRCEEAVAYR